MNHTKYIIFGDFQDKTKQEQINKNCFKGFAIKKPKMQQRQMKKRQIKENENKIIDELVDIPDKYDNCEVRYGQLVLSNEDTNAVEPKFKRPYSAQGFKVTNSKMKLTQSKNHNKDEYIKAYKE